MIRLQQIVNNKRSSPQGNVIQLSRVKRLAVVGRFTNNFVKLRVFFAALCVITKSYFLAVAGRLANH